jgi:hypothetical protein
MKPIKKPTEKAKPYEPTARDVDMVADYKAARDKLGPRLKVTTEASNAVTLGVHHPDELVGTLAIMRAIGTDNVDFYNGLAVQLVNASKEKTPSEAGANFMLAVIKGIEPRDQVEAMLAAQMAAVHMASMTFARRLAHVENIPQQDSAERAFNKLTRTFAAQVAALKDYRSKGEQKMTVQHVHVAEGGQAIVGNVNTSKEGGGAREKTGEQPHALGYEPGEALPCDLEADGKALPIPSGARS